MAINTDPPAKKKSGDSSIPSAASTITPAAADGTHAVPTAPVFEQNAPVDLAPVPQAPEPMARDATALATPKPKKEPTQDELITAKPDGASVAPRRKPVEAQPPEQQNTLSVPQMTLGGQNVGRVLRPAAGAAEELITTVVNLGADIRYAMTNSVNPRGDHDAEFLDWYRGTKGSDRHGLKLKKWTEEVVGPQPDGGFGFLEEALQFTGGLLAANRILKAPSVMGKMASVEKAGVAAKKYTGMEGSAFGPVATELRKNLGGLDKAGLVADLAFMDPAENNFFGIVDKSPDSVQTAIHQALASDPDSPETWNRLRVGLQGLMVGRALDVFVGATRSIGMWQRAKKLPAGSAERRALEGDLRALLEALDKGKELPKATPEALGGKPLTVADLTEEQIAEELDGVTTVSMLNKEMSPRVRAHADSPYSDVSAAKAQQRGIELRDELDRRRAAEKASVPTTDSKRTVIRKTGKQLAAEKFGLEEGEEILAPAMQDSKGAHTVGEHHQDARDTFLENGGDPEEKLTRGFVTSKGRFIPDEKHTLDSKNINKPDTPVMDVVQNGDGTYGVTVNGKPTTDTFSTAGEANATASSIARYFPKASDDLLGVTSQIQRRIASGHDPRDVKGLIDGTAFNFHWVSTADNAKAWINAVAEASPFAHQIDKQGMAETRELAQKIFGGQSADEALTIASEVLGGVEDLPAKIWGLRAYQHATAGLIAELSTKVDLGTATAFDADQLRIALGTLVAINPQMRKIGTRVGQSLNAFKGNVPVDGISFVHPDDAAKAIPVGEEAANMAPKAAGPKAPANAGVFANFTKTDLLRVARHIRLAGGDPDVVDHYLRTVFGVEPPKPDSPMWMHFQAVRYNSMLSGPLTHMKNIFSNFGLFAMKNAELMTFGLQSGNKEQLLQGWDQLSALWWHSGESWDAAAKAVKHGSASLDKHMQKEGLEEVLDNLSRNPNATDSEWLARLWHAPQTMLMAEDEFFKTLNYRASIRAQALAEARRLFPDAPEKWGPHLKRMMDSAFSPGGGGLNSQALEMARENTFTRELVGDAKKASDFIGNNKFFSFFFPFRRTPINIFLSASERTPGLWRLSTTMREEMLGIHGPRRTAEAMAKLEMGKNLWLFAAGLAASGHLTGGGPRDKEKRRQMVETGWQAYSVKNPVDGKWVSMRAFEPLATLLGIAGDAVEGFNDLSRDARQKEFLELVGAFTMATAANATNKTFMKGALDMSNFFSGRESAGANVLGSLGQQAVPFGGLMSQVNPDPVMRDARSITDRVISRIPYFSEDLEPVRTVLGKELPKESWVERTMWPLTISEESGTAEQKLVKDLIEGVGENVQLPMPEARPYGGLIDLQDRSEWKPTSGKNQSPYDRMMELMGTGVGKLPPVQDALRAVVDENHAEIKKIFGVAGFKFGYWKSARPKDGIDITESGTRLAILRGVLKKYQTAAYAQVRKEYPELDKMEKKLDKQRADLKTERDRNSLDALPNYLQNAVP